MSNELQSLDSQIAELQAKKNAILAEQRGAALAETRKMITTFGFSAKELGFNRAGVSTEEKTKAAPKFRDSSNPQNTWAGKGAKPKWLKEAEAAGRNVSEFAV